MNILAFDTVSSSFSIALQNNDNSIIEYNKEDVRNHNEEILPVLDNFLKVNNFSLDKIDYIVLGIGPGSFTALRIAFATVKTICYAKNIPIVGVSSLETLYENISEKEGIKAAMIDARKGSVYANIYNDNEKITENNDLTYQQFIDIINSIKTSNKNITLCGDGFYKNQDYFKENLKDYKINDLDKSFNIIRASNSIKLSLPKIKSNNFDNIFNLLPLYLRNSEAENKKNK
ncbi:tRNA (adenosine(37)-N6)-threonylcarbamoyltransferase complex dimerization subunit type 1 TsaB [Brachyspira hampsonii]|uniref:tRNA (Adenosine(37)-N6)-threonylcarbamoyltransferase complex dimerization subunit type 1 TsaB n=1 Tax=Brachyspira hampsonii TaxID=1287055 RepID=A0AAC9TRC1_9SPIR|nr:tRNA (adenosine(37)-N6)-threonylcarbamoyltransferase complex dimerization subunit type 1 TsaB [Brachyspira hampsonii]ASJ20251.1 tRNA (adenosine(37)-N6)-threonylcarbamoyltransferase complex dimerization subunit type 1 TsaB [Brachyspira hampsonii]MBW5379913.1 tRNA (adenosine(37)-N6)-threonylcarbamoyltransferase complex dimerization subunit type 1 TsaB [Brachyspira hampsonii]MBW5409707.1 tRNA (adenosine(37)-N6)-threonylcarbamoyltransferase complex dimerization subunit type 1 TsaB [Brachyspira ha